MNFLGILMPWPVALFLIMLILTVVALIEVLKSDFKNDNDKIIWVAIILFLNIIGTILYFAIGRKSRLNI